MTDSTPRSSGISWLRPWLLAVAILATLAVAAGAGAVAGGRAEALGGIITALAVVSGLVLVPILITTPSSRWDVDAKGVGGRDNWHVYRRVAWTEIASVTPVPIPGYRFVWVNARNRRQAIWLPLFLDDMEGFLEAVVRHADPDNPLRRYLEAQS